MVERQIPINELDASFMTINPAWGSEVSEELYFKLQYSDEEDKNIYVDEEGNRHIKKRSLWGILSYYTRDLRLGNLNIFNLGYCIKYLDFAGDCLRQNYIASFLTALNRVIAVIELTQSYNGFLRRRSNTVTREEFSNVLEPKKKPLFSNKNKNDEAVFYGGNK